MLFHTNIVPLLNLYSLRLEDFATGRHFVELLVFSHNDGSDDNDVSVFVGKISLLPFPPLPQAQAVKDMTIRANFRAISRLGLVVLPSPLLSSMSPRGGFGC